MIVLLLFVAIVVLVAAQDPADGWLGYAKATSPSGGRITYMEAKWVVLSNPTRRGAFFSPWFGIEASDNLNLIQPVNPWSGDEWEIYNEYFQWSPEHNENSDSHRVKSGDVLFGSVTFNPNNQSYTIYHSDLTDGWSVSTEIPVQDHHGDYKNYTIAYVVFEKVFPCEYYPPDNVVTFYDIKIEYDNQVVDPVWTTSYVDDACNNRAHIVNSTTVQITWDTSAADPSLESISRSAKAPSALFKRK